MPDQLAQGVWRLSKRPWFSEIILRALHFSQSIPALKSRGHIDRMLIGAVSAYINSRFQRTFSKKGERDDASEAG